MRKKTAKTTETRSMRAARLPFGDWYYFPRKSLNIVNLSNNPDAPWKPVHISIALTSRCEKNCDFCYANSGREGETLWKLGNILEIVESCDRNGIFAVTLGGGEPSLWHDREEKADFYDLLNELNAIERGCDLSFTTSGVPSVRWSKIPQTVLPRLSLHRHQEIEFIEGEIEKARDNRGSLPAINMLVRKGEIAELLIAAEKLAKTGVRDFLLIPLKPMGRAFGSPLVPSMAELEQLVRSFPVPNVKLTSCCRLEQLESRKDTFLGCGAGDWFVCIDERRRIKSCSFSKTGIPLSNFEYREILDALSNLERLDCHSRIRLESACDQGVSSPECRNFPTGFSGPAAR